MPAIDISQREELRGLGEELVCVDCRAYSNGPHRRRNKSSWTNVVRGIVAVADRDLHDTLRPYDDPALLESNGEQLLDFVIRLASKQQWKCWLESSMVNAASTGATDVFFRLVTSYGDYMNDVFLTGVLMAAGQGGSVEVLSALVAAGAGLLVRAVDEIRCPINALHLAAKHGH